ncbi:MAG: crossover junction endodeoxyribonuclease RuvC [Bacteroidetes bacterium]|nr:crossover junction endodeoxyribonuclease RuvC [Bacteroidota bacterium]
MGNIILGIDPGSNIMGYGILSIEGSHCSLITYGILKLGKIEDGMEKFGKIFTETSSLIQQYKITDVAIEAPFFGKNVQSMLKLGRAQGIAIAAALSHKLPVTEYAPRKIKMSVTGKGTATKEQVAAMLQRLLKMEEIPQYLDATDAIAVALCHHFQNGKPATTGKKYGSWESFVTQNPERKK